MTTRETLDVLCDDEAQADLLRPAEDSAAGEVFTAEEIRAELNPER